MNSAPGTSTSSASRLRGTAAGLLALALAFAGLTATAPAALADVTPASAGTLSWGFKQSFRTYITATGSTTASGGAAKVDSTKASSFTWTGADSTFDPETGAGDAAFTGKVRFLFADHGIDLTVSDPRVVFDGNGKGDLYWTGPTGTVLGAKLTGVTVSNPSTVGGLARVTVASTGATFTTAGGTPFTYDAGTELDNVKFTVDYDETPAASTSTALSVSSSTVEAGGSVRLSATVPSGIDGRLRFYDGSTSVGTVSVVDAAGSRLVSDLSAGTHSFTARFLPTDTEAWAESVSSAKVVTAVASEPLSGNVSGATLDWPFSAASAGWSLAVDGGAIVLDGSDLASTTGFRLSDGTGQVSTSTGVGSISFPGSATLTPASGDSVTLDDFVLAVTSSTRATLTANLAVVDGGDAVPGPVPVTLATFPIDSLVGADGIFALTAGAPTGWASSFTNALPTDIAAAFAGSAAAPTGFTASYSSIISENPTTTTLAASSARVDTRGTIELRATLAPSAAAGTVTFYEGSTKLGEATVRSGLATLAVSNVTKGAHSYLARFAPDDLRDYDTSVSAAVKVTASSTAPVTGNVTGATLDWGVSKTLQGSGWSLKATDGAKATSDGIRLSKGTGSIGFSKGRGSLSYPGTVSYTATSGASFTLTDFTLSPATLTRGTLTANLSTKASSSATTLGPVRVTVSTFDILELDGVNGAFTLATDAPDFVGEVTRGTYASGFSDSWPASFVDQLPSSIASSFFRSANNAANDRKAPLPITAQYTVTRAKTSVALTASPATGLVAGDRVELTAISTPATVPGTVTISLGSTVLGSGTVGTRDAGTTVDVRSKKLAVGSYKAVATFTPDNASNFAPSTSTAFTLTVAEAASDEAPAGSLTWGVYDAFNSYITGPIADGSISVSNGATASGGNYTFTQTSGSTWDTDTERGSVNYRGAVRFYGHHGLLDQTISNPTVKVTSATSATLQVSFAGRVLGFANLDLSAGTRSESDGTVSYSGVPATLASGGSAFFEDRYAVGMALDSVSFVIGSESTVAAKPAATIAAAEEDEELPATAPSTEGVVVDSELLDSLEEGGEFTGSATGFEPNETGILAVIYSDPILLADDLTADASGAVSWTGQLPTGLTGDHTFTFQGSVDRGVAITIAEKDEDAAVAGCVVDDAAITWGFKESFRSYISGSIANGEWTVSDGASYETPSFGFSNGEGGYDPETGEGEFSFDGTIEFTGHSGALDTTVANPVIQFVDADTAYLLLDVAGVTQGGEEVNTEGVQFVELDLSAAEVSSVDGVTTITDAPTALTPAGAQSFGTYESGVAFDPITISFSTEADCGTVTATGGTDDEAVAGGTTAPADDTTTDAAEASATQPLVWPWIAATALLLLVVAILTFLLLRRRTPTPAK